jgi:hypothetical protein
MQTFLRAAPGEGENHCCLTTDDTDTAQSANTDCPIKSQLIHRDRLRSTPQLGFLLGAQSPRRACRLAVDQPSGPAALKQCTQSHSVFRAIAPILAFVCRRNRQQPTCPVGICSLPGCPLTRFASQSARNPNTAGSAPSRKTPAFPESPITAREIPFRQSPSRAVGVSSTWP